MGPHRSEEEWDLEIPEQLRQLHEAPATFYKQIRVNVGEKTLLHFVGEDNS